MKDLSKINRDNVLKRWKKYQERELSKINKNKREYSKFMSRLLGYLAGDGNVLLSKKKNDQRYVIRFYPDNPSLIQPFKEAVFSLYGKIPIIKNQINFYKISIYSRVITEDIMRFGNLKTKTWSLPHTLFKNKESKIEWLRAFFDCEAYVGNDHIKINCVNMKGLRKIQELLKEFDIEARFYTFIPKNLKHSKYGILRISRNINLCKYYKVIGFNHEIKSQKLLNMINK